MKYFGLCTTDFSHPIYSTSILLNFGHKAIIASLNRHGGPFNTFNALSSMMAPNSAPPKETCPSVLYPCYATDIPSAPKISVPGCQVGFDQKNEKKMTTNSEKNEKNDKKITKS